MNEQNWLEVARRIQAIAQNGLTYAEGMYDLERYQELRQISVDILSKISDEPVKKIQDLFATDEGYQTPKVDIRGVVIENDKILMIKEEQDGKWSLPGGWADINYSPAEIAAKEIYEEAGITVETKRLLAVCDKLKHPHPPDPYHAYKLFFSCKRIAGNITTGMETLDVGFFSKDELPELSEGRVTHSQIELIFSLYYDTNAPTYFD